MSDIGSSYPGLSWSTVHRASVDTSIPAYHSSDLVTGILHIGVGAFHRAHQCFYFDGLARKGNTDCGVFGVSLRSDRTRDLLARQDYLYTLSLLADKRETRVIGCILNMESPATGFDGALALFGEASLKLVTLTVTEKGYGAETEELLKFLVEGLRRRRALDMPLVIASCDNLQSNGDRMADLLETALADEPALRDWVRRNVRFPNSMVDAITPAPDATERKRLANDLGLLDETPVFREPFCEWVMERCDCGIDLEAAGIKLVDQVAPYELLKLRILNASHSLLAYLGVELGFETVYAAMQDDEVRDLLVRFMAAVRPLLDVPASVDTESYCAQVLDRFDNPGVAHRLTQIAEDGSVKLKERVLPLLLDSDAVRKNNLLCFPLVMWMNHVSRVAGSGGLLRDPARSRLVSAVNGSTVHQIVTVCLDSMGADHLLSPSTTDLIGKMLVQLQTEGTRPMMLKMARE